MKFRKSIVVCTALLALLNLSCNSSNCLEKHPILASNDPASAEYIIELAELLQTADKSKLRYYLESYRENDDSKFMMVKIESEDLCGIMKVEFEDFQNGAEEIIEKKGESFNGAQLQRLQYAINKDGINTKFVFISLGSIVD